MKIAFGNDRTEATKKLMLVDDFINGHQPQFCEIDGAYIEFIVFIKKIYHFFFFQKMTAAYALNPWKKQMSYPN